jgi:hypothetical protein
MARRVRSVIDRGCEDGDTVTKIALTGRSSTSASCRKAACDAPQALAISSRARSWVRGSDNDRYMSRDSFLLLAAPRLVIRPIGR